MSENFDPTDHHRQPRERGYKKETEQIIYRIRNRGDQRIGQLIINALRTHHEDQIPDTKDMVDMDRDIREMSDEEAEKYLRQIERAETAQKAKIENLLWNLEAPDLLEALQTLENGRDKNE